MTVENVWHSETIEETYKKLKTSPTGLSTAEAEKRRIEYGTNELVEEKRSTKLSLLFGQLKNPLVGVLVTAALISLVVGK